ncbi:3' terminal RNA ribose 2'-O-methyltransferase Hen1 [Pseudobacteroides cellulosolvens]|uniref:Small RNA 2'-O-methyltransferase n=1 Tax=Pseudobacteroides cellulosolvens ATCC 35603 = DSM 2933 TaxID=398512 RepID=A0A0L6JHL0_9FIRM|nr:3' terminal RNA ribose 2'-O-methyltransferase Hen1 [Pseudobacteroides cellulosolvens]KNY25193.1 3'-RNA ribose 2'-O-methyltransferase, Hen1, bacterial [Pseudobacteroides cellulosolvens ATCC 35603 = DSM 2933]
MILTITYKQSPATDLGYLLYKNPYRPQTFELSHGKAHVFYPEVTDERCTIALILDIDPIDLARGKKGSSGEGGLFDYVNDRPYVASSFLSVAISRVFGTAMGGKCKDRPELAQKPLPLEAKIVMLPLRGEEGVFKRLFEPLGYEVIYEGIDLDEKFPEWGKSRYYNLTIKGEVRIQELLNHIYVLIPVLDTDKHYWVGDDEIEKLLLHGEGWLNKHPEKGFIAGRYLKRKRSLINKAFERLMEGVIAAEDDGEGLDDTSSNNDLLENESKSQMLENQSKDESIVDDKPERKLNLNQQRLGTVISVLKSANARRVIDIGCGEGKLLSLLLKDRSFEEIAGVDVSYSVLERAMDRLKMERLPQMQKNRIKLFQGSLTYRDKRFQGYDAATVIEVIEHLDIGRLKAFEKVLFQFARPKTVIVSTPNKEYNLNYQKLPEGDLRHRDHRFEWTRSEFLEWADGITNRYGYKVRFIEIGEVDEAYGSPTQMGVFTL